MSSALTNPWIKGISLGLGGIQALSGLFGKHKQSSLGPFKFTPDPNDPEIAMRRRMALLDQARGHSSTIDEIGRAGLLGSSAAFGVLGQDTAQGEAALEDIPNSVYARQRQDALALYRDEANFRRQQALGQAGYDNQEHMAGLDALGNLGINIGYQFDTGEYDPNSIAAWKKRLLDPNNNWDTQSPVLGLRR